MNSKDPGEDGNPPGAWPNLDKRFDMSDGSSWRYCERCGEYKDPRAFYDDGRQKGRTRAKRRGKCRACTRAQMKKRYANRAEFIDDYKMTRGCTDCGWRGHVKALEFDHLPGCVKVKNISGMVANPKYSLDDIKAEIAKCEVVCANCHRIRTFGREYGSANWDRQVQQSTATAQLDAADRPQQLTLEV